MRNEIKKKFLTNNNNKFFIKKELTINDFSNLSKIKREQNEKIKEILEEEMNKECFDCGELNPKYISLNNGIFLCFNCVKLHFQFQNGISLIKNNNLFLLSNKELLYLYYGGNSRLNNFVNFEYPGLQNYQPSLLYQTQAMNYYRNRLNSMVNKRNRPLRPIPLYAYKLIGENIDKYSKNRLIFENIDNNNSNDIIYNKSTFAHNNIENRQNLKFIYYDFEDKNRNNLKNPDINFGSSYVNNSINNTFNINTNWNEDLNTNKINSYRGKNSNFFEEMKNLFKKKDENNNKIRMNSNEKRNTIKIKEIPNKLFTHQTSLSETMFSPNNHLMNYNNINNYINNYNNNNYNGKIINLNNLSNNLNNSLKIFEKDKNNINKYYQVYTKPRMTNNSFSKNNGRKNTIEHNTNSNIFQKDKNSRKSNSIISEMSKFSLKKRNLEDSLPISEIENGFMNTKGLFYTKSNNLKDSLEEFGEYNNNTIPNRNKLNYKLSKYMNKSSDEKIMVKELSFNNSNKKINLSPCPNIKNNNTQIKLIKDYIDYKNKKINESHKLIDNRIFNNNNDYSNMSTIITVNRTEYNKNSSNKNLDKAGKNRNFIKVVKKSFGKRNNSEEEEWKKIDNLYEKKNSRNKIKIKIINQYKKDNKNNKNLNENEGKRILKAIQDKKEQEILEKEALEKLLLDENALFNIEIDIDNLNKSVDICNPKKKFTYNTNRKTHVNCVYNFCKSLPNEQKINNNYNNIFHKEIKIEYPNEKFYFYNKKDCTDLILVSNKDNNKNNKNKNNEKIIPKQFTTEVKNLINFIKNIKNDTKYYSINKTKSYNINYNKYKNNNQLKTLENPDISKIKNIIPLNGNNSIRNKYKQRTLLNLDKINFSNKASIKIEKLDYYSQKSNNNNSIYNSKPNIIKYEDINLDDKDIKNINISEDNWNINLLGEINIYKEIIDIEFNQ